MGRPFGENLALHVGLGFNWAALFGVAASIAKRLFGLKGFANATLLLCLCFVLAFCWMMLCEALYQKRSLRTGEFELKFLALIHFAPAVAIIVVMCLLFLWLSLVH